MEKTDSGISPSGLAGRQWRRRKTGPGSVPRPGQASASPPAGTPTALPPPPSPGLRHLPAGSGRPAPPRAAPSRGAGARPHVLLRGAATVSPGGSTKMGCLHLPAPSPGLEPLRGRCALESERERRAASGCCCRPAPPETGALCVPPLRVSPASPRRTPPAHATAGSSAPETSANPCAAPRRGGLAAPAAPAARPRVLRDPRPPRRGSGTGAGTHLRRSVPVRRSCP